MTGVADRLRGWLVEAPSVAETHYGRAAPSPRAPRLALLASGRDARGLGAGLALGCAGRGAALVGFWPGRAPREGEGALPATPSARRLAGALRGHGLASRAVGRLVCVELAEVEEEAAGEAARAEAVCASTPGVPVVVVVAGPRGAAWDAVLVARDQVVVHVADEALAAVTLARLGEQGARAWRLDPSAMPGALARACALAGIMAPGLSGLREACAC